MTDDLLARIERYYDAVPRRFARTEELGPFTLFLGEPGGWVYYARPRLGGTDRFEPSDVAAAMARLRALGLPETVEWVHQTSPTLLDAVRAERSLAVEELPLLALDADLTTRTAPPPRGTSVRLLTADEPAAVSASRAVADIAFRAAGTARGDAGPAQRDAATRPAQARVMALLAEGVVRIAVAESPGEGIVAAGRTLPLDGVTEVMGVATLPAARRRGLAASVTAALVEDARSLGLRTVFLTAASVDVARVYERVGFARVATAWVAERPSPT